MFVQKIKTESEKFPKVDSAVEFTLGIHSTQGNVKYCSKSFDLKEIV